LTWVENRLVDTAVIDWLLDGDPSIRWQVMRDLLDLPESVWAPERTRVETEGWGSELLSHQDPDGRWLIDWRPRGRVWLELDQTPGQPSRWLTLAALRVLRWSER
jgi:hypothetical protein